MNINRHNYEVKINNEVILPSKKVKYLGIIIDENLNFKSNLNYVCKKN